MSSLQSSPQARTSGKLEDIELEAQVNKQPGSVQAMTKNPAITSANDPMRIRGGGCCVRYSSDVSSIPIIHAYSRNFYAKCVFAAKSYAASSAVEDGEETRKFLIRSTSQ
jgi:hypothetical protein